jgi:hypothetical protein
VVDLLIMRLIFPFTFILIYSIYSPISAHPSYGLVVTKDGDVYFCDVLHNSGTIWKYSFNGRLEKVLTNVHSHYLFLDSKGLIWGTDHDYIPSSGKNDNELWNLNSENEKKVVIPATSDPSEFSGVNFVVDKNETVYFDYQDHIYKREVKSPPELFMDYKFERITSLQMDIDGNIYVIDNNVNNGSVFKINKSGIIEFSKDELREKSPFDPPLPDPIHNMLYASFVDIGGNIYIANSGSRRISRIDKNGSVAHIYYSHPPWYPVAYFRSGEIEYIMETGFHNEENIGPRIIQITKGQRIILINVEQYSD